MAEHDQTQTVPVEQAEPEQTAPEPIEQPATIDSTDWKSQSRKWERRAKDNENAAKRLGELEKANAELTDKLGVAQHSQLISSVAAKYGIDPDLLHGDTEEDLEARAKKIQSLIKAAAPKVHADIDDVAKTPPSSEPVGKAVAAARSYFGGDTK